MAEPKRALTDLRETAQAKLFADWRVTPELREKLRQRIAAESSDAQKAPLAGAEDGAKTLAVVTGGQVGAAAGAAPAPGGRRQAARPWGRRGGTAAAAVAAMVALVMLGQSMNWKNAQQADNFAAEGQSTDRGRATMPPIVPTAAPAEAPSPTKTAVVGSATSLTFSDQSGPSTITSPVVTKVQVIDAFGNTTANANGISFTAADADTTVTTTSAAVPGGAPNVPATESQPGRKIILNAEYSLEVKDAVTAMQRLQTLAATTAGYIVDAALNKGQDGSWAGRLTLRLPASLYNGAITEIRQIGEVKQERQWSQDVTERYYDLEARIRIQQEYEQKLQELAAKAATFDDWMKLTRQINDTRALIEQMQGSIKLLANQVEYSTINISFFQPAPGQAPPPKPPEPAKGLWPAMARSFGKSVEWLGGIGQALLVGAAAFAPFLAALLVLGLAALAVWRRMRVRKPNETN